jgi:hypothetical protein
MRNRFLAPFLGMDAPADTFYGMDAARENRGFVGTLSPGQPKVPALAGRAVSPHHSGFKLSKND